MTQEKIILEHLKRRGRITSYEAFLEYRITRLSGRIFELRAKGYDIATTMESKNGKHYAVYTLKGVEANV